MTSWIAIHAYRTDRLSLSHSNGNHDDYENHSHNCDPEPKSLSAFRLFGNRLGFFEIELRRLEILTAFRHDATSLPMTRPAFPNWALVDVPRNDLFHVPCHHLRNFGESNATVSRFLSKLNVSVPVLLDPAKDAAEAWKVRGLPMTFIVDASGTTRYWSFGEQDWSQGDPFRLVESLVREAPRAQR